MSSKVSTISDWIVDAMSLTPGEELDIYLGAHDGPAPALADMRAALYAQFGKDTPIRIYKHGQRISIFIHADEQDRTRFDFRSKPMVIRNSKGRVEIEAGFEKKLPSTD